ncbi:PREDICTED: putative late blight resistance protein homolog R1B-12 isoform X2 [Ipomoea nil]|uniref:putative late blight resistance protein homolog R1B-12 isoform X2 n=1 Tax=Ipomoea nil TaxID=35883 RepID=UPI0009010201|nr:PREDICTED: putative late blight resistance protein homolog R1B-12 isoform X2 [Ipomoea nil]
MKLEGIWRHIVEYCKGLPLAIVIVAGLVQTTNESLRESQSEEIEKLLCATNTMTKKLSESLSKILRLSYNHLPNVLRVCFLYLGVFREDSAIAMKKLIRFWIAEGFVKVEEDERSLEEVGEDYLKDLVSRSLVLVDSLSLDGKIKSCKVHDIVHKFCRNEAMKEGLLRVADSSFNTSSVMMTQRWLSFESMYPIKLDVHNGFNWYGFLFCFYDDCHMTPQVYQLPETPYFKRLRVLDLGSLHFINGIPSFVADLILLRYLALRPSKFLNSLPVLKDWNLQTLVLLENWGGSTSADNPNPLIPEIWELPKLRHLQVCTTLLVLGTPTVVHQYIQTVQWLRPFQCTEQVFLRIPDAKVMGIFMEGRVEFGQPNCLDNLRYLGHLEELKIESRHNPVLLPVVDAFPIQLKKLKLKGTLVPWDAMKVIVKIIAYLQIRFDALGGHW